MTAHLLLVTLGPVQEFIAQARRTRDLWYGSHLLSELGRAAARALCEANATLIFPALGPGDEELEACTAPLRPNGAPPLNIANKLLALVPEGKDPEHVARGTRAAVMSHWREGIANVVKKRCDALLAGRVDDVWDEQIDSFVEFLAAWAPIEDGQNGYRDARKTVERALAARKNLRDFAQWQHARPGALKSSLDGARDSVLRRCLPRDDELVRKYRISPGEELDAVGLVKRAGGDPEQFVPLPNVALASWLAHATQVAPGELTALSDACGKLRLSRVKRKTPAGAAFGFEAGIFFRDRCEPILGRELQLPVDPSKWVSRHVQPVLSKLRNPYPYVACLVADGDRMGQAIDSLDSAEKHQQFSSALATFARDARGVVEMSHRGSLVYSGGDDVLAFLPIPEALACADSLREAFERSMKNACLPGQLPTLSVGLGIGHVMDGMGDLLDLGRAAEREAKHDRNALAIIVDKRSGGERRWRASWAAEPVQSLTRAVELLAGPLSTGKVYEIAAIIRRLPTPSSLSDPADPAWTSVLVGEVKRALQRNEGGGLRPEDAGPNLDDANDYKAVHLRVTEWANRMLIARTFQEADPKRGAVGAR